MTKKAPAFQFYPKDWLSSLSVTLMTAEQEGAYIRLLCYCWDSGDCSLPADEEQLIKMSRISKGGWEMVGKCFIPHPEKPGFLTNKKLLEMLHEQCAWKVKSSIGGKRSGEKRSLKAFDNNRKSKGGSTKPQPDGWEMVATKSNPSSASASALKKEETSSSVESQSDDVLKVNSDDKVFSNSGKLVEAHLPFTEDAEAIRKHIVSRLPKLARQNAGDVPKWLAAGLTIAEIVEVVDDAIEHQGNIGSFRYFTSCLDSLVEAKRMRDEQDRRMREKYAKPI